ncbi:peroxidase domain-containing protein, partial [Cephalotus follicularis]
YSCPQLEDIVSAGLKAIFLNDPTSPAALLRLMFHDCQVQGCDGSILVDLVNRKVPMEMASAKNFGIRKRESISIIKSMVEEVCPQQVSCADILILAAREAVVVSGGPFIKVPLGRRDSTITPSNELADAMIPSASIGVDGMLHIFASKGMSIEESVAIMGAHTLGITHCSNIVGRLYSQNGGHEPKEMEPGFAAILKLACPLESLISNFSFVLNDPTSFAFDNMYYRNAIEGHGILRIDSELALDPRTASIVKHYATYPVDFFQVFSSAFVKLSLSGVLIGNQGVIREKCNAIN